MLTIYLQNLLAQLGRREEGQTAVEYGLVIALIALVVVVALSAGMTTVMTDVLTKITDAL